MEGCEKAFLIGIMTLIIAIAISGMRSCEHRHQEKIFLIENGYEQIMEVKPSEYNTYTHWRKVGE